MRIFTLFLFAAVFLQACNNDVEIKNAKSPLANDNSFHKDCVGENKGVICDIPIEATYTRDFIGKTVKLRGVLILVDDIWGRMDEPKRFEMYASPSSAEVCAKSSGIGIIPKNEHVYAELLKYDGYIIEIFGVLKGNQDPYSRFIEVEMPLGYSRITKEYSSVIKCGKIPPPPPLPPSP